MADHALQPLLIDGGVLFEGPRYRDGVWWTSDIFGRRLLKVTPDGDATNVLDVPARPSGLGFLPDGSLLMVSQEDRRLMRLAWDAAGALTVTEHADLSDPPKAEHGLLNDMVVDALGRAWVGEFGFDIDQADHAFQTGNLYRVDLDGQVTVATDDAWFPNGMVITADQRSLIVGETLGNRYSVYEIGDNGALGPRRTWASFGDLPPHGTMREMQQHLSFTPDGCCLDAAGHVWAADPRHGRLVLVEEGGAILDEVVAPEGSRFIACMLGGEDGRTMLASTSLAGHDYTTRGGCLYTFRVDVGHAGLP